MPVLDGYEATQHIKATSKGKQTVVIVVSASVVDEDQTIVIATGCDAFLRKPFHESEIFDLLRKYLRLRFVYEGEEQSPIANRQSSIKKVLTSNDLAALPKEVVTELQEAVEDLDVQAVNRSIDRIRQQNNPLAEALAELVKRYRFDALQELFEKRVQ